MFFLTEIGIRMKNIVIIGAARSGKSTLAKMLHKDLGLNIIGLDPIITAFHKAFPSLNISHAHSSTSKPLITPFISEYANALMYYYPDERFVIEGYYLTLDENITQLFNPRLFDIIVVGYPQLTPDQVLKNVRQYDREADYTRTLSDDELLSMAARHIHYSQEFQRMSRVLDLTFIDTSYNRTQVLENALEKLKAEIVC